MTWLDTLKRGIAAAFRSLAEASRPELDEAVRMRLSHVYSQPQTAEVWAYGQDTCIYCGRVDPKRTRFTDPPCTRIRGA